MITTPTVSGKPGQAPTGVSCDLYPLIGSHSTGPILGVPSLGPDHLVVQPDATVISSATSMLIETKRIRRSSFQVDQLAREIVALLGRLRATAHPCCCCFWEAPHQWRWRAADAFRSKPRSPAASPMC
jgi:hypothetical protein